MNFIYYNVSGKVMEILQFLLSFFLEEYGGGKYKGVYEFLKENSFDVKKAFSSLNPEKVAPIIKDFMSVGKQESPFGFTEEANGLNPVKSFADDEIIEVLNDYFSA